jgi:DNA-binding phage protein
MAKERISPKRRRSLRSSSMKLKKNTKLIVYSPTKEMLDETFIANAVWECLKNNDPEGVMEVIQTHLEAVNKMKAAQHTELPRSTLYNALKGKNPTIKTLAKLVNCFI